MWRRTDSPGHATESTLQVPLVWMVLAVGLFGARWLLPAEAPEQGRTLWIAAGWLALAAAWMWRCARLMVPVGTWDRWDLLIVGLCGGHLISALAVLMQEGQKRSASTMFWEWLSLGIGLLLCRRLLRDSRSRSLLVWSLVAMTVALAGLGLWQRHVWYPSLASSVQEWESLAGRSDLSDPERERLRELRDELGVYVALLDSTARDAFRQRILFSTEPIGRFALANTFAALLTSGVLLLLAGLLKAGWRAENRENQLLLVLGLLLTGYVLLLTKSRTAWIGGLAGLFVLLMSHLRHALGLTSSKRMGLVLGLTLLLAGGLVGVAWQTGGLDSLVISESGKSFRYRLEYWTASLRVVAESPWLGVGPGNFRQHYLAYKLPGSSEEVLDPHNLFLDVWTSGGLLAVGSLLGWVLLVLGSLLQPGHDSLTGPDQRQDSSVGGVSRPRKGVNVVLPGLLWSVLCIGFLPLLERFVMTSRVDEQLIWLTAGGWLFAWGLRSTWLLAFRRQLATPEFHVPWNLTESRILLAVAVALGLHLLAAGGMGMPAIAQWMLLASLPEFNGIPTRHTVRPRRVLVPVLSLRIHQSGALAGICGLLLLIWTCLLPVLQVTALVQAGDHEATVNHNLGRATRFYEQACQADSLDPTPWNRRAQVAFARWRSSVRNRDDLLQECLQLQQGAILRDPRNPRLKFEAGEWCLEAFRSSGDEQVLDQAIAFLEQAWRGYPNSSWFAGTLAMALHNRGDVSQARVHAVHALDLDRLNREAGHTDKLLPEELARELAELVLSGNPAF